MTTPNHWTVAGNNLTRTFITENYDASFDLAYDIKEIADDLEHHPDVLITYNTVVVSSSTHQSKTLTDRDYELAEAINEMYDNDDRDYDDYLDDEEDDEDDELNGLDEEGGSNLGRGPGPTF